jgi:hypothetical protein
LAYTTFYLYKQTASKFGPLSLDDERRLVRRAKKGDRLARKKLLLHLIGFFIFRIETTLYPAIRHRFGEDILQECLLFAESRIPRYNLRYKDERGIFKKVYFRTYLWKGVTGVMLTYIKKNRNLSNLPLVEYG